MNGTPVASAARAHARSPWPSWEQIPMAPIGLMNSGVGWVVPNSSIERSRWVQSIIMRGIRPQSPKASTLRRWVASLPQPPCT